MSEHDIRKKFIYYNLYKYYHNGYVYAEFIKGMYRIPQEGPIVHDQLVGILKPFVYAPMSVISGLW